jgi:KDO2-lipid IV(A) lauroyltransferase
MTASLPPPGRHASGAGHQSHVAATLAAYRLALGLSARVPPVVAYPLLDRIGDLIRLAAPGARAAVGANLEQVIGNRGRRHGRAVRGVFRHTMRNYYDTFRLPTMTDADISTFVALQGVERLDPILARGHGAILFSAHVSSVVVGAQALALAKRGGTVVVEPVEPPELLDLMLRVRGSHGLTFTPLGPRLAIDLGATLRRNELAFLVVDRDLGGNGMLSAFFGRETRLPIGPALLAIRTGAPIVPTYVRRRRDGRLNGMVGEPLTIERTGNLRTDLARITRQVTSRLEYHIGRYPEQWTVLQRVWDVDRLGAEGDRGSAGAERPRRPTPTDQDGEGRSW